MHSWCDVVRDLIPQYAWISSREANPILIKLNIGEFYEKLSYHLNFHLDPIILTIILRKSKKKLYKLIFLRYLARHAK
jgi:hypothetical protein